jgi:hypothetical protein
VWCAVVLFAGVPGLSPLARADIITILPDKDNTLYEDAAGSLSNGAGVSMFVGLTQTGLARRAVMGFDIAGSIPEGAFINSASLTLELLQTNIPTQTIEMRRLTANWGEGTSNATFMGGGQGAPSTTNDATWVHRFFNTQTWNTTGGDFSTTVSASQTTAGLGSYTWTSSQLRADVQAMLDAPGTNFGWILIGNGSPVAPPIALRPGNTAQPPCARGWSWISRRSPSRAASRLRWSRSVLLPGWAFIPAAREEKGKQ